MTIKVKHILLIIIIIVAGIILFKPISSNIKFLLFKKDILNFVNKKSTKNISSTAVKRLKLVYELTKEKYDISSYVNNFIQQSKKAYSNDDNYKIDKVPLGDKFDIQLHCSDYSKHMISNIDYDRYVNEELFHKDIVMKLENVFEHENGKWYIKNSSKTNIELPLGCYATFTPYTATKNDIDYFTSIEFDEKPDYIKTITGRFKYMNNNGFSNELNELVEFVKEDNSIKYNVPIYLDYFNITSYASLTLGSHDADEEKKRESDAMQALIDYYRDDKSSAFMGGKPD